MGKHCVPDKTPQTDAASDQALHCGQKCSVKNLNKIEKYHLSIKCEYDQEMPQTHITDQPMASRGKVKER